MGKLFVRDPSPDGSYILVNLIQRPFSYLVAYSEFPQAYEIWDREGRLAKKIAAIPLAEAFTRGLLCNALVCLAVWLAIGARSVTDKILAILFPITAFVAIGFEHSIANWFFLPFGLALDAHGAVSVVGVGKNLLAVSAGNVAGGTLLVAGVYWVAYLRGERMRKDASS